MTRTIGIVARRWAPLEPLLRAYTDAGLKTLMITSDPPGGGGLANLAEQIDALLVVGDRRRAPSTVLPGPVLRRRDGVAIPAGWLPDVGDDEVRRFARIAAELHRRASDREIPPVAVLSQWHPQYLRLAQRIEQLFLQERVPVFRWTSDIVYKEDMARGLQAGLAAAIYVGHGRSVGWVGYYGTRIHHLQADAGEALGALLSLCCRTASRQRTSLSFAESVPLKGIAGAAFGAIGPTAHIDNTRWAVGLCSALGKGVKTVGEWIVQALPTGERALASYRLLGDPLSPILAADSALERAFQDPHLCMNSIITPSRPEIMDLLAAELRAMGVSLPDILHEELSFRQDLGLDSLAIVEFVARMELVFHVEVADQEWRELVTLGLVADYIETRLGK